MLYLGATPFNFTSYAELPSALPSESSQLWQTLLSSRLLLTLLHKHGFLMLIGISLKPQPSLWQTRYG